MQGCSELGAAVEELLGQGKICKAYLADTQPHVKDGKLPSTSREEPVSSSKELMQVRSAQGRQYCI